MAMAETRTPRIAKPKRASRARDGTQSLRRAISILRLLSQSNEKGLSLADAVRGSGLNKATTHRILNALVAEGFAAQDGQTRNYFLGFELVALGIAANPRYGIAQIAKPFVTKLAEELGDTIYLSVRSRDDAVCVMREVGSFPIKTLTFPPGARTPLGLGSGSVVLLAFLSEAERTRIIRETVQRLQGSEQAISEAELTENVKRTRKNGYASVGNYIVNGMRAIAMPIHAPDGTVTAAISVASIEQRLDGKRLQQALKVLQRERAALEQRLRSSQIKLDF